jgi:hypothetical protein
LPEGSKNAAILIAISYQALQRQLASKDPNTQKANCTVVILFAGFYIEATLDYIVSALGMKSKMLGFLNPSGNKHYHPGIQQKLAWFYNEFVARDKATSSSQFKQFSTYSKLRRKFKGFAGLYKFRNDVSHGRVNRSADSLSKTQNLRDQAKAIRRQLYEIAQKRDPTIRPDTTYQKAIAP